MRIKLPRKFSEVEQWGPIDTRLLYPSFWFGPMSGSVKSRWGIYWAEMVGIMQKDTATFYWWRHSLENVGVKSIKRWLLPDEKRKLLTKEYYKIVAEIRETVKEFEQLGTNANFEQVKLLAVKW